MLTWQRTFGVVATGFVYAAALLLAGCTSGSGGGSSTGGGGSTTPTVPTTPVLDISVGSSLPLIGYVGVPTSYYVTVSSGGPVTVTLSNPVLTNTNGFALAMNCPATLTAYAHCIGLLTFTPTVIGTYSTAITVMSNAPGSPQTLNITATAQPTPAPSVVFSPTALSFSGVTPNTSSTAKTLTLVNSGNAALSIASIAITGANPGTFNQSNACPATLPAGSLCSISVTMQPTAPNTSYNASLTVTDNAGNVAGSMQSAALSGTSGAIGAAPQLTIAPSALDFTGTPVGTYVTKSVTLSNSGSGALNIGSAAVSGPIYFEPQSSGTTCGTTLAAGASCLYAVTFNAALMGTYQGAITFTDNALGSPQVVPLTASAVQAVATFNSSPVSFDNVAAGTTSSPYNLTLSNTGNIPLTISSLTLAPSAPAVFAETNTCGPSLAPGALCTLTFTFTPTAAAAGYSSALTLVSNASPAAQTVPVYGTSTGFAQQTTLHVEPDEGYGWLYTLVGGATTSVDLVAGQLADNTLLTYLTSACARGVRVRAILGMSNAMAYAILNGAGGNCSAVYTTFSALNQSSVLVDNNKLAVTTATLTSATYATLRDYGYVVNDPLDIASADATFSLDYAKTTPANYLPSRGHQVYWTPDPQAYLASLIYGAQYSVLIESETITSPAVVTAIEHACGNANLQVGIVLGANAAATPAAELNYICPNAIYLNNKVHGTIVLVDEYHLQTALGTALIAPMPLDDGSLLYSRSLGAFVTGSDNYTRLSGIIDLDASSGTPYR